MVFFRVTNNINIKTTDGTLVKYLKFKGASNLNNETIYTTTLDDFDDLKQVFSNVDEEKYIAKLMREVNIKELKEFPLELGITNFNEYNNYNRYLNLTKDKVKPNEKEVQTLLQISRKVDLLSQLKIKNKREITVAIIGCIGKSIGEIISSSTALRIFYEKLKEVYSDVKIDIYINASNNTFYSRDKDILSQQSFINQILPLSLSIKKLCEYDYYVDNSSINTNTPYYQELNFVDAWLNKFGINYDEIPSHLKYNHLDISEYKPKKSLEDKLNQIKKKGKLLLFHPFSANVEKSIPQAYAIEILRQLVQKANDYTIVSALSIDPKTKDDRYLDLSRESKSLNDFIYIISQMDKIISVDTSTYHIADAFMIPTITIFLSDESSRKTKYYDYVKTIELKDKSKSLSKFIFENENLVLYKFLSWEKFKVKKIIKLLETF
jgi:hypothetical protein